MEETRASLASDLLMGAPMRHRELAQALNADHDPDDYAICPTCKGRTEQSNIRTGLGLAIIYCCDACGDEGGPMLSIPHLERFRNAGEPSVLVH